MNEDLIVLQNRDLWLEMMLLNTKTFETEIIKRRDNVKIRGHNAILKGNLLMLYRKRGRLYLNVNDKELCLEDNVNLLYMRRQDGDIQVSIQKDGETVFLIRYPSFRNDPVNQADFDFNSDKEEHYDFFLFVYNVMNDPERKGFIYTL
ncbi:hypothetical protein [Marininema halotolerans]|uniref:Uncharacterized protein n=1 Tax=Marininema halotolerans TaxID=1155944 RepID=A0A1I6UU05_9BACL|nr:hypothetical protein [Marininema halotolerans]SFT04883.1 hypothetical protein SAMN05444972_1211 [Marininema halotolerans]